MKGLTDPSSYPAEANEALLFFVAETLGGRTVEELALVITAHELMRWRKYYEALETARALAQKRANFDARLAAPR